MGKQSGHRSDCSSLEQSGLGPHCLGQNFFISYGKCFSDLGSGDVKKITFFF